MTTSTEPIIRFDRVDVHFNTPSGTVRALDSVTLDVAPQKFTTVVGPSGCGKTTLLRLASGLVAPSGGRTLYKGQPVNGLNARIGFVTQESNLFPWLTLIENVEFPLAVRGVRPKERRDRARDWLKRVGLEGFDSHYPFQLSGGMQKRASIVRTLIYEPEVVLMDEPFGPLDAQTRMQMQHDLLELWQRDRKTILFITHDLVEAIALSDTVVIMSRRPGRVLDVFQVPLTRPRNVFEIYVSPGFDQAYKYLWNHFRTELGR